MIKVKILDYMIGYSALEVTVKDFINLEVDELDYLSKELSWLQDNVYLALIKKIMEATDAE